MRVSSERPTTVLPFSLNSTGMVAACAVLMRSIACLQPSRYLVRKVFHHGEHRVGRRLPQAAYGCVHHRLGKFPQQRLVPGLFFDQPEGLRGADAAGRALTAGLLREELDEVPCGTGGAVLVRENHDRRRAERNLIKFFSEE